MILDTTFLVDVLRGDQRIRDRLAMVDQSGTPFVSAISIMELAEGIRLADASATERDDVDRLLEDVIELPFDRECAMEAGRHNADLIEAGKRIDETDVMIAATAIVYDHPVVTRNTAHFERFDGLDVLPY